MVPTTVMATADLPPSSAPSPRKRPGGASPLRATLVALAGLGLTACGLPGTVSDHTGSPAAPPSSAQALAAVRGAAAGALSESAALSLTLTGATAFGASSSSVAGSGSFDFRSLQGSLSLTPSGARQSESVVFAPSSVYVRPLSPGGSLLPGKPWVVARLSNTRALTTNFPEFLAQVESLNPALTLDEIIWGSTAAATAGDDRVEGQPAIRYDIAVDLNQALLNSSGSSQTPFALALQAQIRGPDGTAARGTPPTGAHQVRVEAWVGPTGRLMRVRLEPPRAGLGTVATTFSSFGSAVRADPPAPGQVVDIRSVAPVAERESNNGGDSDGG